MSGLGPAQIYQTDISYDYEGTAQHAQNQKALLLIAWSTSGPELTDIPFYQLASLVCEIGFTHHEARTYVPRDECRTLNPILA